MDTKPSSFNANYRATTFLFGRQESKSGHAPAYSV